jgi:hypothetical protein
MAILTADLTESLKSELISWAQWELPLATVKYMIQERRSLKFSALARHVARFAGQGSSSIIISNISDFTILSLSSGKATYRTRLISRIGSSWAGYLASVCLFESDWTVPNVLMFPIMRAIYSGLSFAHEHPDETADFLKETWGTVPVWIVPLLPRT